MIVFCGIPDIQDSPGKFLTQLFIDFQRFIRMIQIKGVHQMIKYPKLVQNQ